MRNERGVALVLAILVLTVIGALVAAAFFAATQEQRMAEHARWAQHARGAAELALGEVLRQWPETGASGLGAYPTDSLAVPGDIEGFIYRLTADVYLIDLTGHDRADRARQRLGLLVRRSVACDSIPAEAVELSLSKCHTVNTFQKTGAVWPLTSRSWIQLF